MFAQCSASHHPPKWNEVPQSFRDLQQAAVENYDLTAIWKGTRGPITTPEGKKIPALPLANQLTPANEKAVAAGHWPQYFVGGYPNCFKVTEAAGHDMGQAPGTHWDHAHKHGSTSINLFNGLAGALIIEGDYDRDLRKIYPNLQEKVMVVQVFTDLPNLQRAAGGQRTRVTNGTQVTTTAPVVVMRPGEIQLWRIVNAQVQSTLTSSFSGTGTLPQWKQIAADGVQFSLASYNSQPLTTNNTAGMPQFSIPAGSRIDVLVQAPMVTSPTTFQLGSVTNVTVCGDPLSGQAFPTARSSSRTSRTTRRWCSTRTRSGRSTTRRRSATRPTST